MANLSGYMLTNAGKALYAKATSGACTLKFTKVKLGEAETSIDDLIAGTDLVGDSLKNVAISACKATESICTIYAIITNTDLTKNFLIRQIGVYAEGVAATNPPEGTTAETVPETLFAVAYDTLPDILPANNQATAISRQFTINLTINNSTNIEVTVSPLGLTTNAMLNNAITEHNTANDAHAAQFAKYLPLTGGTTTGLVSLAQNLITNLATNIPTNDSSGKLAPTAWVQAFVSQLSQGLEVTSDDTGHFECPALGITGLMAQNGYIALGKLFGGLIMQWGTMTIENYVANRFHYPTAFKKKVFSVSSQGIGGFNIMGLSDVTNSSFACDESVGVRFDFYIIVLGV